jgi:RimJ/RimL family protein N-acetyltransferase
VTTTDEYPGELECDVTLPDRRQLHIRPLRPDEEGPVRELDARLSMRTRYLRFLSPMPSLPDSLLRLLVTVDYRCRLSLIAEVEAGGRREVIALGSFGAIDGGTAEVGLVVSDAWQRQGIGTILARAILQAAEDRGFARFVAHLLWENTVMRRLLKRVGHVVSSRSSSGTSEITFVRRVPA